jgi:endonuclease-3
MGKSRKPSAATEPPDGKQPFDIALALRRVRRAVKPYPKAALFELAEAGYRSVFELLAACLISIRTRDETTLPIARRLFARARTPAAVAALSEAELGELLSGSAFAEAKARQIREIAVQAVERHGGDLPCDREVLLGLKGVGPKCANLTLGIACEQPFIGVDIHVHRVTNRWGYVRTASPEKTMAALEAALPRRYWIETNALLVPFGKHVCTGVAPNCSTCPLLEICRQVAVTSHR